MAFLERIAKLLLSVAYMPLAEVRDRVGELFGRERNRKVLILMYHSVPAERLPEFIRHVETMSRMGRIIPLGHMDGMPEGDRLFVITFDDGFRSTVDNALPFLTERDIPATLFIPSGSLGGRPPWVTDPAHEYAGEMVIDDDDLRRFPPRVAVGSHGVSHRRLTGVSPAEARWELSDSKESLERITGNPVRFLAFPYGAYDAGILALARESGYEKVFAGEPLAHSRPEAGFLFGRLEISPDDWRIESWLKLRGAYDWLPIGIRWKRKIGSRFQV
jgi:peptidoglycan/xylan/chitin deacetylase (PgdA/CDA1 family)